MRIAYLDKIKKITILSLVSCSLFVGAQTSAVVPLALQVPTYQSGFPVNNQGLSQFTPQTIVITGYADIDVVQAQLDAGINLGPDHFTAIPSSIPGQALFYTVLAMDRVLINNAIPAMLTSPGPYYVLGYVTPAFSQACQCASLVLLVQYSSDPNGANDVNGVPGSLVSQSVKKFDIKIDHDVVGKKREYQVHVVAENGFTFNMKLVAPDVLNATATGGNILIYNDPGAKYILGLVNSRNIDMPKDNLIMSQEGVLMPDGTKININGVSAVRIRRDEVNQASELIFFP